MKKIAVIDSGIGGLTVAKQIINQLPNEEIIYFGDNAHCPYGDKTFFEIKQLVYRIINTLLVKPIKALVVACNTITSFMIEELKERLPFPVIGVIEPGVEHAAQVTKNQKIGVIATQKTIETNDYEKKLQKYNSNFQVYSQACPRLVPLIESEKRNEELLYLALEEYIYPLRDKKIDTLILGCTHYPIVQNEIQKQIGNDVTLVDPAFETTRHLIKTLEKKHLFNQHKIIPTHEFYTSGNTETFQEHMNRYFNQPYRAQHEKSIPFIKERSHLLH